MVDPDACVFPMVGPGSGYTEMVTGDFIKGRESQEPVTTSEEYMKKPDLF